MDYEVLDPEQLLQAVARALSGVTKNSDGKIDLGPHQFYYFLDPAEAYMSELRTAPVVELVGDLCDDIDYVNADTASSYGDPSYLLERLSHVLRYIAFQTSLDSKDPV